MSSKMYSYSTTASYMRNLSHRTVCTLLKSVSYLLTLMTKFECRLRKKLPHTLQLTDRLKVAPKCLLQSFSALRLFGVPTLYIQKRQYLASVESWIFCKKQNCSCNGIKFCQIVAQLHPFIHAPLEKFCKADTRKGYGLIPFLDRYLTFLKTNEWIDDIVLWLLRILFQYRKHFAKSLLTSDQNQK